MPKIDFICSSCHHKVELNVGQVINNRKIGLTVAIKLVLTIGY
jgi:hypothetical protein